MFLNVEVLITDELVSIYVLMTYSLLKCWRKRIKIRNSSFTEVFNSSENFSATPLDTLSLVDCIPRYLQMH